MVDCDLTNVAAQSPATTGSVDTCGSMTANFGKSVPGATYDPELLTGFGNRLYNWEFAVGVQQELMPRVSVDVGLLPPHLRQLPGDRQPEPAPRATSTRTASWCRATPSAARRCRMSARRSPASTTSRPARRRVRLQLYNTLASNYGKQIEHWNGVDINVTARLAALTLAGGVSSGKLMTDNCEIVAAAARDLRGAASRGHTAASLSTHGAAAGLLPPGGAVPHRRPRPGDLSHPEDRRPDRRHLSERARPEHPRRTSRRRNAFMQRRRPRSAARRRTRRARRINLLIPNAVYGERVNQIDMRISKIFRMRRAPPARAGIDVYNLTNADTVLAQNNTYATNTTIWQTPDADRDGALLQAERDVRLLIWKDRSSTSS